MSGTGEKAARRSQAATNSGVSNAKRRRCPRCLRQAALSAPVTFPEGRVRKCNYCGHEVGIVYGKSFGRDVTPEPGVKAHA